MKVSNCSVTPTTRNLEVRLSLAWARAHSLPGSQHWADIPQKNGIWNMRNISTKDKI